MKNAKIHRYQKYAVMAVVALVMIVTVIGAQFNWAEHTASTDIAQSNTSASKSQADRIEYKGEAGKTALALLKEAASGVVTQSSSYGEYVESVGTLTGSAGGKYWTLYIDGVMSTVGADAYVAHGGEVITWKFEKLQ